MSRALSLAILLIVFATGCAVPKSAPVVEQSVAEETPAEALQRWVALHGEIAEKSADEAVQLLVSMERPENEEALYHYALLNQQLESYGAWVQARDAFTDLQNRETLSAGQRQLAGVMLAYNQNRINAYLRVRELIRENARLQQKLSAAEDERALLEARIQALTDLETDISTRREE